MNDLKIIETLLNKLNANAKLRKNVSDILNNYSDAFEIYPNTIINGLSIGLELKNKSKNIAFISPMQSGKSGSVFFLNYVLTEIGFLRPDQNILFLTSMRDKDLYDQNVLNMQKQYFDCTIKSNIDSRIYVMKIDEIFKYPNPFEVVRERNIGLFIRDEDQYGAGIDSTFDCGFMQELRTQLPDMPLVSVSATPFDILDAVIKGYPVSTVKGAVPKNYLGISKMLELGLVENIDDNFSPYTCTRDNRGRTIFEVSKKFNEYMKHLLSFEDGLGIIRVSKSEDAFALRRITKNKYNGTVKTVVIGSDSSCDYSIAEGISQVKILVNTQKKRVLLIVVNALSAGKDFKSLKEKIRFGIETRKTQLANGAQGIPGRICGYHSNRTFKLLASLPLLEKYQQFENNWNVIMDEQWRNDLMRNGIRGLSTQVSFEQKRKEGEFTPIINDPIKIAYDELITVRGRKKLSFLDDAAYNNLLNAFDKSIWFEQNSFRLKATKSKTTIRVASSYNAKDNRVYKLWNKYKKGDDFGDVMFKKKEYNWGLLVSNIPVGKKSKNGITNELGFRGIEIYKAGTKTYRKSNTITDNHSMYNK
jgi:hypothetical protein